MSKCKYEGSGVWEGRCTGTKEVDPCPGYDRCDRFKPDYMTNADHIRSMTDEEMAAYILCPRDLDPRKTFCTDLTCIECAKDWLKQPYKEDT